MADDRTYIRLHDGMPDHPKIDALSDRAFRLLISSWCWCSRHLTDGRIPDKVWAKRGTAAARRELITEGLAEPVEGGVHMHDYLEHQRSAEEVAILKATRREAGRKGGLARAKGQASAKASARQTRSKTQASTETETDTASNEAVETPRFADFWAAYPRRADRGHAVKAWAKAIKNAEPQTVIDAAARFAGKVANSDPKFIPHAATWLNGERWLDEEPTQSAPSLPHASEIVDPPDGLSDAEYAAWWQENHR